MGEVQSEKEGFWSKEEWKEEAYEEHDKVKGEKSTGSRVGEERIFGGVCGVTNAKCYCRGVEKGDNGRI